MADRGRILIVGGGGLVGGHLTEAWSRDGARPDVPRVPWSNSTLAAEALRESLEEFFARLGPERWTVVWAAGAGVVATSKEALAEELDVFRTALTTLEELDPESGRGVMVLVSSAGGIHAGSEGPPFSEYTPARPLIAYGETKLAMEQAAAAACSRLRLPLLVARPSNIYGPGQRLNKPQGLLSQIALSHLTGRPLPVLVSQDTLRDYVFAPDVARLVVRAAERMHDTRPEDPLIKIIASGTPTSVGHVISEARRVFRRPLRTVTVAGSGQGQVRDLRFLSQVWTDLDGELRTTLPAGLAATLDDIAFRVRRGGDLDART